MRRLIPLLVLLLAGRLVAAPLAFPQHNFAVELPSGWVQTPPPSATTLVAAKSANGQQFLLISAVTLGQHRMAHAAEDTRKGIKRSYEARKLTIDSESNIRVGTTPFLALTAHDSLTRQAAYTTAAGSDAYEIQFISTNSGPVDNPAIEPVLKSFRLLQPAPFASVTSPTHGFVLHLGGLNVLFIVAALVIVGGVMIVFFFRRTQRKEPPLP